MRNGGNQVREIQLVRVEARINRHYSYCKNGWEAFQPRIIIEKMPFAWN